MGGHQEGRPKNGGPDREMIVQMSGGRAEVGPRLAIFVKTAVAKTGVGMLIVRREIEIVLNQKRAGKSIVAHSVATNPGIHERKSGNEKNQQNTLPKRNAAKVEQEAYFLLCKIFICQ